MTLTEVNAQQLRVVCEEVLNRCFAIVDNNNPNNIKVKGWMLTYITENAQKYESLGLHYLYTSEYVMEAYVAPYAKSEFIKLLSMTNNLTEYSSIPLKDGTTETHSQNGGTFSMSENQPINATEAITTPYIKVSGKNNYSLTKETQHNTVNEYKVRQEIMNGNIMSVYNFVDSWMEKLIYEYNIAY